MHHKGNNQEKNETAYAMLENSYIPYNCEGFTLQDIQGTRTTQ
jgi:hypothetical protein